MSTREIENLLGYSLTDTQRNRYYSLERAEQSEPGLGMMGSDGRWLEDVENSLAMRRAKDDHLKHECNAS